MVPLIRHLFRRSRAAPPDTGCPYCHERCTHVTPTEDQRAKLAADRLVRLRRRAIGETALHNKRFIALLKDRPMIKEVTIALEDNACAPCRNQALRVAVYELPVLPWVRCTKPEGCGCWYEAPRYSPMNSEWLRVRPMRR